jgi:hypothetical protein
MHTPLVNNFLSLGCQTYCAINLPFCFFSEYGVIYRMQSIAWKENEWAAIPWLVNHVTVSLIRWQRTESEVVFLVCLSSWFCELYYYRHWHVYMNSSKYYSPWKQNNVLFCPQWMVMGSSQNFSLMTSTLHRAVRNFGPIRNCHMKTCIRLHDLLTSLWTLISYILYGIRSPFFWIGRN